MSVPQSVKDMYVEAWWKMRWVLLPAYLCPVSPKTPERTEVLNARYDKWRMSMKPKKDETPDGYGAVRVPDTSPPFVLKDSGEREQFDSGMQRDTETGKVSYDLCFDGPMFERWAVQLTKGAKKYDDRNWMKASGEAEIARFRRSAARHFIQWLRGDMDEDHAAAVFFNINGHEYVKEKTSV
jgi:hypothetical protein